MFCVCVYLAEADGGPAWRRVRWEAEGAEREERAGIEAFVSTGQGNFTVASIQVLLNPEQDLSQIETERLVLMSEVRGTSQRVNFLWLLDMKSCLFQSVGY